MEADERDAMAQEEETQTEREHERFKRDDEPGEDPNAPGYRAEMAGANYQGDDTPGEPGP